MSNIYALSFFLLILFINLCGKALAQNGYNSQIVGSTNGKSGKIIASRINAASSRAFFNLFNLPHIICYFAAKGRWPYIPEILQARVNEVSRSLFVQNDEHIRNYCQGRFPITQCHRPYPPPPPPVYIGAGTTPAKEIETFDPESEEVTDPPITTTPCSCAQRQQQAPKDDSTKFLILDKSHVGDVDPQTILNTIDFLKTFLPQPEVTTAKKKKTKTRPRTRD